MRVLLVGDDSFHLRTLLAAARALASARWRVGIASPRRELAASSRRVSWWHPIPAPTGEPEAFVRAIRSAVDLIGYDVVLPAGDAELVAVASAEDRLGAIVPCPSIDVVRRAHDKLTMTDDAKAVGIATPRTLPASADAVAELGCPVFVKARLHWSGRRRGAPARLESTLARSPADALARATAIEAAGGAPVFQEYVPGRLVARVALVAPDRQIWGHLQQTALRLWPPDAGVSTRAETMPLDHELTDRVTRLLRRLDWTGLAQLQFIVPRTGEPRLIDFNGRLYGSLALAAAAGLNYPSAWAGFAMGQAPSPPPSVVRHVRYQWLEADLHRALTERRGGLVRDVLDCLRYRINARHSLASIRDPWPGVRWVGHVLGEGLRRVGRRLTALGRKPRAAA